MTKNIKTNIYKQQSIYFYLTLTNYNRSRTPSTPKNYNTHT